MITRYRKKWALNLSAVGEAMKKNTTEEAKKITEIKKPVLCLNCGNLEIWQSGIDSKKHKACSVRELIAPKEEDCAFYILAESLCVNCINLEIWNSNAHSVSQKACSVRKILVPKEKDCPNYKIIGDTSMKYLCRTCTHLATWVSSDKTVTSEVCEFRQLILPTKEICEHYKGKK